ncbi:MAG TPA: rhodanese-like domain-containing protein, partial [Candidatus Binatia bacterium]|nr:rhodanese-like domain-containing protein [Candidatus Binatia bacterium]
GGSQKMNSAISSDALARLMASEQRFAVFDVRERGEYNQCQIPNTTSLPRSQIEFRIHELVPDREVQLIIYDDGAGRARLAAATLARVGYRHVALLDGGLSAWQSEGRATVSGVNVPSKAFGERVHHERNVPDLTPEELKSLQDRSADLVVLDVRTPEEYGRFCIPGGINVPGGDLILWAEELKQRDATHVVVNCAGRTRSIIGAAALRRLGVSNVRALRNGTMGWVLAGFELDKKPQRSSSPAPASGPESAMALARRIAQEEAIAWISAPELSRKLEAQSIDYLLDVRSEGEFASGHVAGSINVPGGQAVQRADDFVAVRNGQIVFISNQSARAVMTAYWYRQMGFLHVAVLQGGLRAWTQSGAKVEKGSLRNEPIGFESARQAVRVVDSSTVEGKTRDPSVLLLDVGTSLDFETAHLPRAKWISRGWVDLRLPEIYPDRNQPIVMTCADGCQSILAALALGQLGYSDIVVLDGGVRAWSAAGFLTEQGVDGCLVEPNDVVLSPSIRGTKEDMQRYLDWELTLTK